MSKHLITRTPIPGSRPVDPLTGEFIAGGKPLVALSEVAFGAAPFGGLFESADKSEAIASVKKALELGVNYFDCALYYGGGTSLEILGEALGENPPKDLVISVKVGRVLLDGKPDPHATGKEVKHVEGYKDLTVPTFYYDYSAEGVKKAFDQTLSHLNAQRKPCWKKLTPENTNFVVYAHDPGVSEHGDNQPAVMRQLMDKDNGTFKALWEMQKAGTIKAYGIGTNEIEPCMRALDDPHISLLLPAGRFTLFCNGAKAASDQIKRDIPDHKATQAFLNKLRAHGNHPKIIAAAIGNSGLAYGNPVYNYGPAEQTTIDLYRSVAASCNDFNTRCKDHNPQHAPISTYDLAVHFPLAFGKGLVASVMPGIRKPEEISMACDAYHRPVSRSLWLKLQRQGLINATLQPYADLDGAASSWSKG